MHKENRTGRMTDGEYIECYEVLCSSVLKVTYSEWHMEDSTYSMQCSSQDKQQQVVRTQDAHSVLAMGNLGTGIRDVYYGFLFY